MQSLKTKMTEQELKQLKDALRKKDERRCENNVSAEPEIDFPDIGFSVSIDEVRSNALTAPVLSNSTYPVGEAHSSEGSAFSQLDGYSRVLCA